MCACTSVETVESWLYAAGTLIKSLSFVNCFVMEIREETQHSNVLRTLLAKSELDVLGCHIADECDVDELNWRCGWSGGWMQANTWIVYRYNAIWFLVSGNERNINHSELFWMLNTWDLIKQLQLGPNTEMNIYAKIWMGNFPKRIFIEELHSFESDNIQFRTWFWMRQFEKQQFSNKFFLFLIF